MFVIAKVKLVKPVNPIQTKTGTPMSSSFGFADIGGEKGQPVGVVGFNNLANELGKYTQGSTIRAAGTLQENGYTNRNGEHVDGYQIVLDGIAGVKSARGVKAKPRDNEKTEPHSNQSNGPIGAGAGVFFTSYRFCKRRPAHIFTPPVQLF
jgi:single-stranded DNA-binding protein